MLVAEVTNIFLNKMYTLGIRECQQTWGNEINIEESPNDIKLRSDYVFYVS